MEENDEEIKEEAEGVAQAEVKEEAKEAERVSPSEETVEILLEGKTPLEQAEYYIAWKRLDEAQDLLYKVHTKSGRKYYLQSLIYKERKWYNEQRRWLKKAVKEEPDREDYQKELAELEEFAKTKEYKKAVRKHQMGEAGNVCGEACCEGCCYGVCACICEGIGNGC